MNEYDEHKGAIGDIGVKTEPIEADERDGKRVRGEKQRI